MKFLIAFILLIGALIGCAPQLNDLESRISSIESKFIEPGVLKAKLKKIDELEAESEAYRKAFLFIAEEMDKQQEAIKGLYENDDAIKEILTIARDLIELLDHRQDLHEEEGSH